MIDPIDMASDLISGRFYVADFIGQCLWKVEKEDEIFDGGTQDSVEYVLVAKLVVIHDRPISLSVTETGQVFVIDGLNNNLTICIGQDETPEVVTLKDHGLKNARHMMQISPDTYYAKNGDRVSLVDRNWKFVKHYGGLAVPVRLCNACHLTHVAANGPLFVIDADRVLVLCSNLTRKPSLEAGIRQNAIYYNTWNEI